MTINIIYASTSGNVEAVCEKISQLLNKQGFSTSLNRAEQTEASLLTDSDLIIFATSTWEHGELNPFFRNIFEEMKHMDFSGKSAAFIGLGDTRYEPVYFCEGMEILKSRFLERGGGEIGESLRIDGEPYSLLDSDVSEWTFELIKLIERLDEK
jgi:flavodoxin I